MDDLEEFLKKLKSYSAAELEGIAAHVDRHKYPERYAAVLEELARKKNTALPSKPAEISKGGSPWTTEHAYMIFIVIPVIMFVLDICFNILIVLGALALQIEPSKTFLQLCSMFMNFVSNGMVLVFLIFLTRSFGLRLWEALHLKKESVFRVVQMILMGAAFAGFVHWLAFNDTRDVPLKEWFSTPPAFIMYLVGALTFGPLVEEMLWRGFIYPAFEKRHGRWAAIAITSAGFALIHVPQLWGAWLALTGIFITSIGYTSIRAFSRSTTRSTVCHLAYNWCICLMGLIEHFSTPK